MGDGSVYPFLLMACNKEVDSPNDLNDIEMVYKWQPHTGTILSEAQRYG